MSQFKNLSTLAGLLLSSLFVFQTGCAAYVSSDRESFEANPLAGAPSPTPSPTPTPLAEGLSEAPQDGEVPDLCEGPNFESDVAQDSECVENLAHE